MCNEYLNLKKKNFKKVEKIFQAVHLIYLNVFQRQNEFDLSVLYIKKRLIQT